MLEASRSELRAVHELTPQAQAGWKPSIDAQANVYSTDIDTSNFAGADGATTKELELSIAQPLYRGGRTTAQTERSYDLVKAQYGRMLQTEQQTFLDAVTAHCSI